MSASQGHYQDKMTRVYDWENLHNFMIYFSNLSVAAQDILKRHVFMAVHKPYNKHVTVKELHLMMTMNKAKMLDERRYDRNDDDIYSVNDMLEDPDFMYLEDDGINERRRESISQGRSESRMRHEEVQFLKIRATQMAALIEELQKQNEGLAAEADAAVGDKNAAVAALENMLKKKQEEIEELQKALTAAEYDVAQQDRDYRALEEWSKNAMGQLKEQNAKLERVANEWQTELQRQKSTHDFEYANLKNKLMADQQKALETAQKHQNELHAKQREAAEKEAFYKKILSDQSIAEANTVKKAEALKALVAQYEQAAKDARSAADAAKATASASERQALEAAAEKAEAEGKWAAGMKTIDTLRERIKTWEGEARAFKAKYEAEVKTKKDEIEKIRAEYEHKFNVATSQTGEDYEKMRRYFEAEKELYHKSVDELELQRKEIAAQYADMQHEYREKTAELARMKKAIELRDSDIAKKDEMIRAQHAANTKLAGYEREYHDMYKEFQYAEKKLREIAAQKAHTESVGTMTAATPQKPPQHHVDPLTPALFSSAAAAAASPEPSIPARPKPYMKHMKMTDEDREKSIHVVIKEEEEERIRKEEEDKKNATLVGNPVQAIKNVIPLVSSKREENVEVGGAYNRYMDCHPIKNKYVQPTTLSMEKYEKLFMNKSAKITVPQNKYIEIQDAGKKFDKVKHKLFFV